MSTKQRSPAMQFYFRQFAADDAVTSMDLDAVGAHILLMCAAGSASSGYEIPADDRAIRTRLRNPSDADYNRIKAQLLAGAWKISPDGTKWVQDGMRRSMLKQKEFSRLQSERAKGSRRVAGTKPDLSRAGVAGSEPTSTSTSTSSNIKEPSLLWPPVLNTEACKNSLAEWLAYKQKRGERYKAKESIQKLLNKWSNSTAEEFVAAVNHSIGCNYSGLFADKATSPLKTNGHKPTTMEINKAMFEQLAKEEADERARKAKGGEADFGGDLFRVGETNN